MAKNFFDQFDAQDEQTNFFDRFDATEPAREAPKPAEDQGIIARIAGLFRSDRPSTSAQDSAPPTDYSAAATAMQGESAPPTGSLISRIGKALRPEPRSVMEGYQYTPQQQQADLDRRLSYGAGPISQQTVRAAGEVRRGEARSNNPIVNRVAQAMSESGEDTFGDLIARAKDPEVIRAARMAKAEEFRSPGEWAVDTLSSIGQGVTQAVELPVNIIAPSSDMARYLRSIRKEWEAQDSDVQQAERENFRQRLQTEEGFLNKYIATVETLVTSPAMALSEAIKQVPMFLGVLGGAKVGAALAGGTVGAASRVSPTLALGEAISGGAIRAGAQAAGSTAGGVAASAVMAGGDAAGSVYERLTDKRQTPLSVWEQNPDYQRLTADGKSSKEAIEEIATTKARLAAAITAPLGLFGFMGAEAAIASRGLLGAATQIAGPRVAAKTFGKEILGEQLEEGGTQLGANVITRTVDPKQSLTEGVPEAMGTALVTSTPFAAIGAAGDLRARQEPFSPYVDQAARTLLAPQTYDPRVVSPELTVDPAKISTDVSRAASVDDAITAAETAAGTLNLNLPPAPPPPPVTPAPLDLTAPAGLAPAPDLTTGLAPAPTLPGVDPAVEQQYGFDQLRLQPAGITTTTPAAPAPMNAPRPQRIQGTPVDQLTDEQLEQIAGDETIPAITRRGASVELTARRSSAATETGRVEPTLDLQSLTAGPVTGTTPSGQQRVEPTLDLPDISTETAAPGAVAQPSAAAVQPGYASTTYSFLSIPQQPGMRDVSVAPVGGEAAAQSARETAQRSVDAWSASAGQPTPAVFNPASPELDSAVNQIAQAVNSQFAGRIYAYNDNRPEALNGIAIGKVAFVNTANVDVNVARTSLHEFKHTVEQIAAAEARAGQTGTAAQKFVADIDSLYDDMSEAGKRAYLTNFLAKDELAGIADATQREARIQELMAAPETRSEMTADFLGNRATDKQFWADVAQADPEGFRGFVQKWMGIIDNLLAQLRGTSTQGRKESAKVDEYVRDLNRAKMVAREALIAYSKATRAPTTEVTQTEQAPAFSARQPGGAVPVVRIDPGKKKIDERLPELMAAADRVASGEMTPAQYGALANSPQALGSIAPYDFVPAPATDREALSALTENKRAAWNGTNNLQAGERVGLRLDIPAYKDHGVWVNSIHPAGKPTAYSAVSAVTDAVFHDAGSKALGVAQGKAKAPFARIEGRWSPITPDQAVARMQEVFNDPQWTQVGYNPLRHSYFFDRKTGNPVTAAEEVIQIGPLVLAKNATIENAEARNEDGTRKFAFSGRQAAAPGSISSSKGVSRANGGAAAAASAQAENRMSVVIGAKPGEFDWNFAAQGKAVPPFAVPASRGPRLEKIGTAVHQILVSAGFKKLVQDAFGIKNLRVVPLHGSWLNKPEPSFALYADGLTFDQADALSRMLGFAFAQDATVVYQPTSEETPGEIPAVYIGSSKKLTPEQLKAVLSSAQAEGLDYSTTADGKAVKFLHFGSEEELAGLMQKTARIAQTAGLQQPEIFHVRSQLNEADIYTKGTGGSTGQAVWFENGGPGSPGLFRRTVDHVLVPYAKAVGAEGYRFAVQRFAERFGLDAAQQEVIRDALIPRSGLAKSTAAIASGEVKLDIVPTGKKGKQAKVSVNDILWALQNHSAQAGLIEPGDYSPRAQKVIAEALADEVVHHVTSSTSGKSAIGWYDRALKAAKATYSGIFPEINTNPDRGLLFDAILGIASQGNDVFANSIFAGRVYQLVREGNTLSDAVRLLRGTFGEETRAIENNLLKLEQLINRNGYAAMRAFFNKKDTVSAINARLRADTTLHFNGKPLGVDGAAEQKVTGWMVFGPKIGSFINNLHGDYSTLTADLWFSRTWNRILGYSFVHTPALEAEQYQTFVSALVAEYAFSRDVGGPIVPKSISKTGKVKLPEFGQDAGELTDSEIEAILADPDAALAYAGELEAAYRKGGYKEKSDLRRAAKNWIENRQESVAAPRTDRERAFQQSTVEASQKIIKRRTGMDITIADIQAALWYYEKDDLFKTLGGTNKKSEAADYSGAAEQMLELYNRGDLFFAKTDGRYVYGEKGYYLKAPPTGNDAPAASKRQRTAEDISREELAGRRVSVPVLIEDTGQTATITLDAKEALDDVDEREGAMQRLLECLRK